MVYSLSIYPCSYWKPLWLPWFQENVCLDLPIDNISKVTVIPPGTVFLVPR